MSAGWLVDTSAWHRIRYQSVRDRLDAVPDGRLFTCGVIAIELGVSARNVTEHKAQMVELDDFTEWLPVTDGIERRALEVQRRLVRGGHHRSAQVVDLLIAITAAENDLAVLHYDSDFDLIAKVTGQPCEWVVPRGTVP